MLLRTWIFLSVVFVGMVIFQNGFEPLDLIAVVFALMAAFPFAGIAFLIARGIEAVKYQKAFDQVILSSILSESSLQLKLKSNPDVKPEQLFQGHLTHEAIDKPIVGELEGKRLFVAVYAVQFEEEWVFAELEQDRIKPEQKLTFCSSEKMDAF